MLRTPLFEMHVRRGAKMVEFGGWEMPVQYTSILEEHRAVRNSAGLFDISHMGEFFVSGAKASNWLNGLLTNDAEQVGIGASQYTLMLNEKGGVIDDLFLYRLGVEEFFLVVNAAKIQEDFDWFQSKLSDGIKLENRSDEMAALALQGPLSEKILRQIFDCPVPQHHHIERWKNMMIARTGYTGEDGFELFMPATDAASVWEKILATSCVPAGLGARGTLRLEACLPLNGNDLSPTITPMEAGLSKFVSFKKSEMFPGRAAIEKIDPARKSVAFVMNEGSPPPRSHYFVFCDEKKIGDVTSGGISPTLQKGIGMALVKRQYAQVDKEIEIEIRGKKFAAVIQPKPLYKKS